MATLEIRKKTNKVWQHVSSDLGTYIVSKMYCKTNGDTFQIIESGGSKRAEYNFSDITIYDDTIGGSAETFVSSLLLMQRLEALNYVGFYYDGEVLPANLISTDPSNNITLGTDNKLFSSGGGSVSTDWADLTNFNLLPDATLPLAGTEELAIVQGGETKKVAASDLGGGGTSPLKYHLSRVVSTILTGTTSETIMNDSILLPTDYLDNGSLDLIISGNRTCITSGFTTIRMYINSSHSLIGANLIGTYLLLANNLIRNLYMDRNIVFTPTLLSTNNTISMQTGSGTINNARNQNFTFVLKDNPYIIITYQNAQADTTAIFEKINIKLYN